MAKKKIFSIGTSLSDNIEAAFVDAEIYRGELRYDVIPLSEIETDPNNPRKLDITVKDIANLTTEIYLSDKKREELEELQSLANTIKDQGLLNPIIVYKNGDRYQIIAGERRFLASHLAGNLNIQAKVLEEKPEELKLKMLQWVENIERKDLSLYERLNNLQAIATEYARINNKAVAQITLNELSSIIGCAKSQANKYKNLLIAPDDVIELIRSNKLTNLVKASHIASLKSLEERLAAFGAYDEGKSIEEIKSVLNNKAEEKKFETKIRAGRTRTTVNLGATKNIEVGKAIIESILLNPKFRSLEGYINSENLNSYEEVTEALKWIIQSLEEIN